MNIFQGSSDKPFHLSVGAVLTNDKGEICCHYFDPTSQAAKESGKRNLYLLMRETIQHNESINDALIRGAKKKFGAKVEIGHFLGAIESVFPDSKTNKVIRKTTTYFHLKFIEQSSTYRENTEPEGQSILMWLKPKALIKRMETQRSDSHTGLDESKIITNYINITTS